MSLKIPSTWTSTCWCLFPIKRMAIVKYQKKGQSVSFPQHCWRVQCRWCKASSYRITLLKTSLRTLPVAMQPKKSKQNSAQYYQNVMNMIHMTTYKTTNTSSRHNSRSIVTHHVIIFSEGTSCQCHHLFGAAEADFYQSWWMLLRWWCGDTELAASLNQVLSFCTWNHASPGWPHCLDSGMGTIGPKNMRHRSSIIVTSIAAPKESTATLDRFHFSSFSSILNHK